MSAKFNDRNWKRRQREIEAKFERLSEEASAAASEDGTLDERTDAYCAVFSRAGVPLDRDEIRAKLASQLGP